MLVQALAEYADNYLADQLNDAAWEMKPVPWLLEISRQGTFLNGDPAHDDGDARQEAGAGSHADERAALAGEPQQRGASFAGNG
jgi:hypothetical protein